MEESGAWDGCWFSDQSINPDTGVTSFHVAPSFRRCVVPRSDTSAAQVVPIDGWRRHRRPDPPLFIHDDGASPRAKRRRAPLIAAQRRNANILRRKRRLTPTLDVTDRCPSRHYQVL